MPYRLEAQISVVCKAMEKQCSRDILLCAATPFRWPDISLALPYAWPWHCEMGKLNQMGQSFTTLASVLGTWMRSSWIVSSISTHRTQSQLLFMANARCFVCNDRKPLNCLYVIQQAPQNSQSHQGNLLIQYDRWKISSLIHVSSSVESHFEASIAEANFLLNHHVP